MTGKTGWETTADEAIAGLDLHGVNALVTGGTSGIGAETVRVLAGAGARVTLTGRSVEAGYHVVEGIRTRYPEATVRALRLDLADLGAVTKFTKGWDTQLHLLVNNAGTMALPQRQLSPAGHELQFATNHLGHFALAVGLREALAAGASDANAVGALLREARVVSVSSRAHVRAPVDFDDVDFERRPYVPMVAYGQSKTANILFAVEAARRWEADGIAVNAVHPGSIADTNLSRHMPADAAAALHIPGRRRFKTISQGAATTIFVATAPSLRGVSGGYFEDCHLAEPISRDTPDLASCQSGVAWYAQDPNHAQRLWGLSERLI